VIAVTARLGQTPALPGESSIRTFADAITGFVAANGLEGVDAVGSSMGARLVLELARRGGVLGGVVSLNPGGFWRGWERHAFSAASTYPCGLYAACGRLCRR
jgi:pimeloyl-ACP methyl ester carboxylesterase